jgi:hypothetical protein
MGPRFFGADTNVALRERQHQSESWSACYIMVVGEVLFGAVKARLSVLCAYDFINYFSRTKTLGRLGPGRRKQRNHLFHRTKDIAVGFHSGKLVLYRALCRQPQGMAQGGDFLAGTRRQPPRISRARDYRRDSSTSESQLGRFNTSRGLGPSAAPTMPSRSIRSMRCAARP